MLDHKTPLWFLDETFTYFILQRSLEDITEEDIQLKVTGQTISLEVSKLNLKEQFPLPKSIDLSGMSWKFEDDMLTLTLEKAPLGRAIRVTIEEDDSGQLYGEYKFDHMFPPNAPIESFLEDEED